MTDRETIEELRAALAGLLRQTADPDPIHPAWISARERAAAAYQASE